MSTSLLIATDNFLPRWDGISRFLKEVLPGLCEEYDVTVVAPDYGNVEAEGYELVQVPLSDFVVGDYEIPSLVSGEVKEAVEGADLVFSQTLGPIGGKAIRLAHRRDVPIASYIHNIEWELFPLAAGSHVAKRYLGWLVRGYTRFHYNRADQLLLPAMVIGQKMRWYGIDTPQEVVHLGVNTDVFKPFAEFEEWKQETVRKKEDELGLEGEVVIGTHGRLGREKDIKTLMRGFKWVKKNLDTSVTLLVVGEGVSELEALIQGEDDAVWVRRSDRVEEELALMDVYVTSSLTETTSLATLEAMSSGLAVASTPVGYVKEYIRDGYNGLHFDFKDSYGLYRQLRLLVQNEELRATFGRRGRETVRERFTWDQTVEKIVSCLKDLNT